MLLLVQSLARDLVLRGALPDPVNVLAHLALLLLWAGAAVTRRDAFHRFNAACTGALCTVYIAVLFARLR